MRNNLDLDELIKNFKDKMGINLNITASKRNLFGEKRFGSTEESSNKFRLFIEDKDALIQVHNSSLPKGYVSLVIKEVEAYESDKNLFKVLYQFILHLISTLENDEKERGRKLISVRVADTSFRKYIEEEIDNSELGIPYIDGSFFYYFDMKERMKTKEYIENCEKKRNKVLQIINDSEELLFAVNYYFNGLDELWSTYNSALEVFTVNFSIIYSGMRVCLNFSNCFEDVLGMGIYVIHYADSIDEINNVYQLDIDDLENSLFSNLEEIEGDYAIHLLLNPTIYRNINTWLESRCEMNIGVEEFSSIITLKFKNNAKMKNYLLKIEQEWSFRGKELMLSDKILKFKSMKKEIDLKKYIKRREC